MRNSDAQSFLQLDKLIHAYLNQDYEISGDTIEEVVACYATDSSAADRAQLRQDMKVFRQVHTTDLDAAFLSLYGYDFDPELWGINTSAFFDLVESVLSRQS